MLNNTALKHRFTSACAGLAMAYASTGLALPANPILFVTQIPIAEDFTTINATFGNHKADIAGSGRGGDLWIRYGDGSLKNLTAATGYGQTGRQGAKAIAVRDPAVHWSGNKALFSMAVGAPTQQYQVATYVWQLYEITGLGKNDTPTISKVPNQPTEFNNISPAYGSDERIIFVSDRPRNGQAHLKQLDEYEEAPSNSGLWSLNPHNGDLKLLTHSPSGDFNPFVDSYGRVIFTRWDHLQRDQQARADEEGSGGPYGTFNYASEAADAAILDSRLEVFPEPLLGSADLVGTNLAGLRFNHFFPWQINEDGSELETLNHIGRHELHEYFNQALTDDPALVEFIPSSNQTNRNRIENFLQIRQNPLSPSQYYGVNAPEFATHAAGQIVKLTQAAPDNNADQMQVLYVTAPATASPVEEGQNSPAQHSGLYRDPYPLSDGSLVAAHTAETHADQQLGSTAKPRSRYAFRLRSLKKSGDYWVAGAYLTPGISKKIRYYNPDVLVSYSGPLWELQPVEVKATPKPAKRLASLAPPEARVLQEEGVSESALRKYLKSAKLALAVMRNVTSRDHNDRQQPFNLRVAGGNAESVTDTGKVYDIAQMQFFQGDLLRGLTGGYSDTPRPGRRVLAQTLHDGIAANPPFPEGLPGSVAIADDGSVAALLPADRALTWQTAAADGTPVVRERNWLSFQAGEIRSCPACHGINSTDQLGRPAPSNKPAALRTLLRYLKSQGRLP